MAMFRNVRSSSAFPRVKVTVVILSILIGLVVTLIVPLPGRAQNDFVPLYSVNFDDGQAQDWNLVPGWTVDSGNLIGSGHHFATYTRGNWGAQPFSLKFTLNDLSGGLHVNIFARGHDNGLDRYAIGLRKIDDSTLYAYLFKQIVNHSGGNDVEGTFSVDFDRTYTVEIISDNGTIQVYVYKTQVSSESAWLPLLNYTDSSPLEPGTISFETLDDSYAAIDNVEVWGVQPPPTTFTLTGEVFSGEMYDDSHPLSGVVVEAYGSNNSYPNTGQWLTQTTTDQSGRYSLDVPAGYEFYFIHAQTPSGYEAVGADSVNGSVRDPTWIEFRGPLDNQALSRNRFWNRVPAPRGPDLSVRRIDYPHYEEHGYVLMSVVVENIGNEDAPANQLVVADRDQRLTVVRANMPRLRPSEVAAVEVRVPVTDRDRDRTYEFDVTLDPDNRIGELDEENNWASATVFVPPPEAPPPAPRTCPDLSVRRIDDWHIEGDYLMLTAVFANEGNAEAPRSVAALSDPDNFLPTVRSTVTALGPDETVTLDLGVSLAGAPRDRSYVLDVMIDPDNRIDELSESNNRRSTSGIFIPRLRSSPAEPSAPAPPPVPPAGPPYVPYDVLLIIAVIILALWGMNRLLRRRRPGRAPVAPVVAPPVRLIKLWITEGDSGKGRLLKDNKPLQVGAAYSLHAQLQPRGKQAAPKRGAGEQSATPLDVVFFSAENDFTLGRKVAAIDLPGKGSSTTTHCAITPREPGPHRVRVCVYYRNTLLQSAVLDAQVVKRRGRLARGLKPIARVIDYVTSATLTDLDRLPHPALSVVTNQTHGHTHWIGVFSTGATSEVLRTGDLRTFETAKLTAMARKAREQLLAIETDQGNYRFRTPLPLNSERLAQVEQTLAAMAINGWKLYHELFIAGAGRQTNERLKAFKDALASPSLISVARCRDDSTTVPWAALYSQYLDTNEAGEIKLCEEFKAQLAANQWSADQTTLSKKHDLLDSPLACRGRSQCPLKQEKSDRVVCPFGFWGMLHEIEQPLDQVTPTPDDQVPPEVIEKPLVGEVKRDIWLIHRRSDRVHIAMAVYPDMSGVAEHRADLERLYSGAQVSIDYFDDRKRVLQSLKHGSEHVYYFFCHGEIAHDEFRLKLGPSGHPGYISANNLNPPEDGWHDAVHPLIILNGCETMAVTPELLHGFMGTLRHMGAAGIVGSEIPVYTRLARPFGCLILRQLIAGQSIGEAFLEARRHLQRQGNPLGLAYSFYALSSLHLHDPDSCAWCQSHAVRQS
jgi:hypothetical protein